MHYSKAPLSIEDQIARLAGRGLMIGDIRYAEQKLHNISFYRLRAYTYPFQDNHDPNHPFIKKVTFEEIISFYEFDRDLRLLVFDAIERIEIALRTRIVYYYALNEGSHWFENINLYRNPEYFNRDLSSLDKEIDRSDEEFIKHYKTKYTTPVRPPSWMSLEVATLTTLSKMFQNLSRSPEKKAIARSFGLDSNVLENWMHVFSNVRNICAHHSRLYNRKLSQSLVLPNHTFGNVWISNENVHNARMYAVLSSMVYLLDRINRAHTFRTRILDLFAQYPVVHPRLLNFPESWRNELFWR